MSRGHYAGPVIERYEYDVYGKPTICKLTYATGGKGTWNGDGTYDAGPPATTTLTVSGADPEWAANAWVGYQIQVDRTEPELREIVASGNNWIEVEGEDIRD